MGMEDLVAVFVKYNDLIKELDPKDPRVRKTIITELGEKRTDEIYTALGWPM